MTIIEMFMTVFLLLGLLMASTVVGYQLWGMPGFWLGLVAVPVMFVLYVWLMGYLYRRRNPPPPDEDSKDPHRL